MNKRGVSEVVTTILLILLVFIAIAVVWGIVSQILKGGNIDKKDCIYADFSFTDGGVKCYNNGIVSATVERGSDNLESIGVRLISGNEKEDFKTGLPIPQGKKEITTTTALGTSGDTINIRLIPLVGKNIDVACEPLEDVDVTCGGCVTNAHCNSIAPNCCTNATGCDTTAPGDPDVDFENCY